MNNEFFQQVMNGWGNKVDHKMRHPVDSVFVFHSGIKGGNFFEKFWQVPCTENAVRSACTCGIPTCYAWLSYYIEDS